MWLINIQGLDLHSIKILYWSSIGPWITLCTSISSSPGKRTGHDNRTTRTGYARQTGSSFLQRRESDSNCGALLPRYKPRYRYLLERDPVSKLEPSQDRLIIATVTQKREALDPIMQNNDNNLICFNDDILQTEGMCSRACKKKKEYSVKMNGVLHITYLHKSSLLYNLFNC